MLHVAGVSAMTMYDIIYKKREGGVLTKEEIEYFVEGYNAGAIPDYQASAFLMAVFFRGLEREETFWLTDAMRRSGETVDLSSIPGVKVDKHSTGGVGDKTTLIVAPLAAACGVPIAKMSGRGLGFTGGTVDKLESIPGLRTALAPEEFLAQVRDIGLAVVGQTAHIAAADKKIYALRDVTATVDQISLITSSIMSKKLASGSDAIVLDVKCGKGAFMEKMEDAVRLGELMVELGTKAGKKTIAAVTGMDQPLGAAVGNSLEVMEAIDTLSGSGPADITELSLKLAGLMIYAGERAESAEDGERQAQQALESGAGLVKLSEFISAQGGDPRVIKDFSLFPQAAYSQEITAERDGYVCGVEARQIGLASQHTGAGREKKEDPVDLAAGIVLKKKTGDPVRRGDVLAVCCSNDRDKLAAGAAEAKGAFCIAEERPQLPPLFKKII